MNVTEILALISSCAAILFGYLAFRRGQKKDDNESGENKGSLFTELGWIKKGVGDIQLELKSQRDTNTKVLTRLEKVETAIDYHEHRIEKLERKDDE